MGTERHTWRTSGYLQFQEKRTQKGSAGIGTGKRKSDSGEWRIDFSDCGRKDRY